MLAVKVLLPARTVLAVKVLLARMPLAVKVLLAARMPVPARTLAVGRTAVARFCAATSLAAVVGADAECFLAVSFVVPPIRDFFGIANVFLPQIVLNSLTLYLLHLACQTGRDAAKIFKPLNPRGLKGMRVRRPSMPESTGWVNNYPIGG